MGYIRKHKQSIRSGFEFILILTLTIGVGPGLLFLAGLN